MNIEAEIFPAATDSRYLREVCMVCSSLIDIETYCIIPGQGLSSAPSDYIAQNAIY